MSTNKFIEGSERLKAFQNGAEAAMKSIYYEYKAPILSFITKFVRDKAIAEDLMQEVFISIWGLRKQFQTELHVRTFLYITARNKSIDYLRKKTAETERYRKLVEDTVEYTELTETQYLYSEILRYVRLQLNKLEDNQKQVLILTLFDELSTEEIAEKLNVSKEQIYHWRSRGIKQLKAIVSSHKFVQIGSIGLMQLLLSQVVLNWLDNYN